MAAVGQRNLEKHRRYLDAYARGGWFWGLGVEHETYMATTQTRTVRTIEATAMRPERYSVSYYAAYRPGALRAALDRVLTMATDTSGGGGLTLPVLVNSHSFTHCDVFGEHRTTYERVPKPNPRFGGRTMEEWLRDYSAWLRAEAGQTYMWDGDTVEFMTQDFYCATVGRVMAELEGAEARFVAEMATLPRTGVLAAYGPFRLASPRNEPFATYLTHPRGVAMFNNGTLHVNVTLPTRLGWNRMPLWPAHFLEGHRALARLIQWLEPLWVSRFGSPDPFAELGEVRDVCDGRIARFAAGSQRLAVSRYIGLGTYDTERMPTGKILQVTRADAGLLPWYDWLYERTHYTRLDVVGLDLNYSKHGAHGLELRFFDQMPMADLRTVLEQVVVLCDVARAVLAVGRPGGVPNPRSSSIWVAAAGEALLEGLGWRVPAEYLNAVLVAAGCAPEAKEPLPAVEALEWIFQRLQRVGDGYCVRVMSGGGGGGGNGVEAVGGGGCC